MAGGAAGQQQKMRDFVSGIFQGSPDLSILTHAIIRKKYLDYVGLENLSKQEKAQLKHLVEEELIQMKVDQPPSNVALRTEAQDSINHKRPLHMSHSSEDEIKSEKKQKRQKIEKKLEISSDEKDSEIDSKERLCHRSPKLLSFSNSSVQQDSRGGNHSAESESNEETVRSKRKPSLQEARWERGRGRKSPKGQGIGGSQKRRVDEYEETTTDTTDLEEEVKERRKATKGNSLKQRGCKKKVGKGSKDNDPKGKAKNRIMNKQRDEENPSEGGTDLSEIEEISEKKREWSKSENKEKESFSTNKAQQRMGPGTQEDLEGNESEDTSGSGPDEKFSLQKRVDEYEETTTDTTDLEEEVKERRKATKGNSLKQRGCKKKVGKGSKDNDPKGKAKNRIMNKQRDEENPSEGGTDLSEVEEISEKKREWSKSENKEKESFSTNKAQQRMGPGTQEDLEGNESEDTSGSGPDEKFSLQKKMADGQCRRKSRVVEDLGSSSEDSANQSPGRKEGAKRARGERGSQQTGNHSKPKRQPKDRAGRKKMQREDLRRKKSEEVKKMTQTIQDSTGEESESKSGEHKSSEEKKKCAQDPASSEGKSQSEMNQGLSRKASVISLLSEEESDGSKDGDPGRTPEKKSKDVSGSDSSQGEEELKEGGAQKSQRKSIGKEISLLSSDDARSELKGKKKIQSQQQRRTKKLQRKGATKEKQEEGSSQEEDEPTTSQQHHHGKVKKHHSGKSKKHSSIQRLKRYIWACGVHRNYKKLLAGCHSCKAQIQALKDELGSLGIKGTPSLAKCKALKQKREEAAEMASLDVSNIIATEGRPRRRKVWSLYNKPQESPSLPEEPTVRHHTTDWSQFQETIILDGESS